jgi:hypothetical protein
MIPPTGQWSAPSSAFGYYRGGPVFTPGGTYNPGGSPMAGPSIQGLGVFSQGQGAPGSGGWHPTILYLLALVIAEVIVFGFLSRKVGR